MGLEPWALEELMEVVVHKIMFDETESPSYAYATACNIHVRVQ